MSKVRDGERRSVERIRAVKEEATLSSSYCEAIQFQTKLVALAESEARAFPESRAVLLAVLDAAVSVCRALPSKLFLSFACKTAAAAFAGFSQDEDVCAAAFEALAAGKPSTAFGRVVRALAAEPSTVTIQHCGLTHVLYLLALDSGASALAVEAGCLDAAVAALRLCAQERSRLPGGAADAGCCKAACAVLGGLIVDQPALCRRAASLGAVYSLLETLRAHASNRGVQSRGFFALLPCWRTRRRAPTRGRRASRSRAKRSPRFQLTRRCGSGRAPSKHARANRRPPPPRRPQRRRSCPRRRRARGRRTTRRGRRRTLWCAAWRPEVAGRGLWRRSRSTSPRCRPSLGRPHRHRRRRRRRRHLRRRRRRLPPVPSLSGGAPLC